jgi:hypothetical protein
MQAVKPPKRDFNLIRKIILQIETSFTPGQHFQLPPYPVNDPTVNLHVFFLKTEAMIEAYCDKEEITGQVPVSWIVDILPAGYDFLALIKDDNNWNTVMDNYAVTHKEPTFKTLIYALEHIEESLYLKEQRALIAKQDEYTATIKKAAKSTMWATWVMAVAIIVQIVLPLAFPSHSTSPSISHPTIKVELPQNDTTTISSSRH